MEKRTLLAIGLCLGIYLVWFLWIQPPPKKPPAPATGTSELSGTRGILSPPSVTPPVAPVSPPQNVPVPETPHQEYPALPSVDLPSSRFKVTFTCKGAGIESLILRYPDERREAPLLSTPASAPPHFALRQVGGPDAIETLPWKQEVKGNTVEFRYLLRNGVEITKKFELDPDKHVLRMAVTLRNSATSDSETVADVPVRLEVLAFNGLDHDSPYRYEQYLNGVVEAGKGPVLFNVLEVEKGEKKGDASAFSYSDGDKDWMGLRNRFFTTIILPTSEGARLRLSRYALHFFEKAGMKNLKAVAEMGEIPVGAQPVVLEFAVFAGPLDRDLLLSEGPKGADTLVNYGGGCLPFAPVINLVAPLILGLLKAIASLFGNYGVAIIFTTLAIRLCMFPLSKKSQVSAFRMQQLGPKIQALRERYKDDQQKFGLEQMRLFKEHKINPLSGCLPMFVQLPIFMGMYSVFELSIELRRAPFFLWMRDLSQTDALLGPWPPVHVPLLITTLSIDSLNLLPILMTITWFLQSYFAPRSPDPQMATQQKMMMFMPIVFGLMCYSLASGLSLYFLVNSLLGMAEQKIIKKYFIKPLQEGAPA